jgi:trehalose 6-phosphate synthase/phosphatase
VWQHSNADPESAGKAESSPGAGGLLPSAAEAKHTPSRPPDRSGEDFLEGGVELPPEPRDDDDGEVRRLGADEEQPPPCPAPPLPALHDPVLEEFWPRGQGLRALFLDYDGTLREFESLPELAVPTEELSRLMDAINDCADLAPHIISGRDAKFLEENFGSLKRFTLIAEHGFQIWRPGTEGFELMDQGHAEVFDTHDQDWQSIVRAEMSAFVTAHPGSFIEQKASALVWHYRQVQDEAAGESSATQLVEQLEAVKAERCLSKIRISYGHKVVEVSYRKVRKGPVMRQICEEKAIFGEPFLSVLVAGDDTSDESMFDIAPGDFLTIKVGRAPTHAKFHVDSPADLRRFLWQVVGL